MSETFRIDVIVDPRQAGRGIDRVDNRLRQTQQTANSLNATLNRAFALIGVGAAVRQLQQYSDAFTAVQNRLRTTFEDQVLVNTAIDRLATIANNTRAPLESIVSLFQRGSISARELGVSNEELLVFVERVGQALAIQGTSAASARGALTQLGQALGSGIVRAEEFNSILEGAPVIAQAAARGFDRAGGSVAQLRNFVIQAQFSSQNLFRSFLSGSDNLAEQFGRTVPTISQAFTVLNNRLTTFVGRGGDASGVTTTISAGILALSENLETVARAAIFAGTAFSVNLVQRSIAALNRFAIALAANPVGAFALALTAATSAAVAFSDQIIVAEGGAATLQDVAVVAFNEIQAAVSSFASDASDALAQLFNLESFGVRDFATGVAFAFDTITNATAVVGNVVTTVFLEQFQRGFAVAQAAINRFRLTSVQVFEDTANLVADVFRAPLSTILSSINAVANSVAGLASVATSFGVISEDSRLAAEDAVSSINAALDNLGPNRRPPPLFDVEETRRQIAELDSILGQEFTEIGDSLRVAVTAGLNTADTVAAIDRIFDDAEVRAKQRAARIRQDAEAAAGANLDAGPTQDRSPVASRELQQVLRQVEARDRLKRLIVESNQLQEAGIAGAAEASQRLEIALARANLEATTLPQRFEAVQLAALDAANDVQSGFERAFIRLKQEAADFASAAEASVNVFTNAATDALTDFVLTGQFSFREFAAQIIQDIARIIIRLLVLRAVQAAVQGGSSVGSSIGNLFTSSAGAGAGGGGNFAGGRQFGGTVQPGQRVIVGENGPEELRVGRTGTVIPNPADREGREVNLQVINVTDPNEVTAVLNSGDADESIINAIARNPEALQNIQSNS